ncbi:hypothetical protein GCM10023195_43010 [Actinoallomurus liliacearum]|uniref:CsbD-like domain-containing protein n=1 Tax=Actinoallomurus liliacearum TaxID=1080073 RepID=A0ABP8TP51_9ACTN
MSKRSGNFVHGSVVPSGKAKIDSTPHTSSGRRSPQDDAAQKRLDAGMAEVRGKIEKAADVIRRG